MRGSNPTELNYMLVCRPERLFSGEQLQPLPPKWLETELFPICGSVEQHTLGSLEKQPGIEELLEYVSQRPACLEASTLEISLATR